VRRAHRVRRVCSTTAGVGGPAPDTPYDRGMSAPSLEAIQAALATVNDPEIRRPITELDMVKSVEIEGSRVSVGIFLTIAGCPMKSQLITEVTAAVQTVDGVEQVAVDLDVMSDEQRTALKDKLRGGQPSKEIPFARAGSLTRVYAVASGKGGVGKSSVTVNLAAAMAAEGLSVGVCDADIYGFSVPRMLGVNQPPTRVDDMILPPIAHGVKVISIGMFVPGNQPVVWRGPMLHRALEQFLTDVFWGDLDVLLMDLPPGTGDIAISVAQLIPTAEILVVTTPQRAAAEVAERAGAIALQTKQQIVGVVENMSWLQQPDGSRLELFGSGGGQAVADSLGRSIGAPVSLLGQVPIDMGLREGGDSGLPIVLSAPDSASAVALRSVARQLGRRARGLAGRSLGLTPAGR
jgi:ATP-binding protein involved in chromosome partitioning